MKIEEFGSRWYHLNGICYAPLVPMGNKHSKSSKAKRLFRVLVLGAAGCGKTTFTKQMRIIYHGGFTKDEQENFKTVLLQNIVTGMQDLVRLADKREFAIDPANRKVARRLLEPTTVMERGFNTEFLGRIKDLWEDNSIQQVWKDEKELRLNATGFAYFMENLERCTAPNFIPSNDDILHARQRTTGSNRVEFTKDKFKWELVDVGGQLPERKKWEPIIDEGCNAVIFLAGMDEYNVMSTEDLSKTKLKAAIDIFEETMTSNRLIGVSKVLFLNKVDLFEKKLATLEGFKEFKTCFPQYDGTENYAEACDFMIDLFRECLPNDLGIKIHAHVTCALDTSAIGAVFDAVKDHIFMTRLGSV